MENKEIGEKLTLYMWHEGKILTELISVSSSTDSPIIVQTFRLLEQQQNFLINLEVVP